MSIAKKIFFPLDLCQRLLINIRDIVGAKIVCWLRYDVKSVEIKESAIMAAVATLGAKAGVENLRQHVGILQKRNLDLAKKNEESQKNIDVLRQYARTLESALVDAGGRVEAGKIVVDHTEYVKSFLN